jgi:hypothetical protein
LLLTLENNYMRWLGEAKWNTSNKNKAPEDREPKNFPSAKYTNSGNSKRDGRSKRLQGWAQAGFLRFNELYNLVAKDRRHRSQFEADLLLVVCADRRGRQEDSNDKEEEIFPANDLVGLVAPAGAAQTELDSDEDDDNSCSSDNSQE